MTFKFKSAPTKGLSLTNGADMVSGKTAGVWDFKHKSEIKYACAEQQYTTKIVASNKDFTLNIEANPSNLNNENMTTSLTAEGKCTPQKEDWEAKLIAKVGDVKLGPVTSFSEIELNSNKAKEHGLIFSQNLKYQDFHCAFKSDCNLVK